MLKKTLIAASLLIILFSFSLAVRHFSVTPAGKNTNSSINTAPLFAANLTDIQGIKQDLGQYQGKIIVLNFWATWCPPCREEMPELSQLHQAFQNKNVVVLGVAIDDPALVKDFLQSSPVNYPILIAENESMDLSTQLGNDKDVLPYTVIINADGSVIDTFFGRISKPLLESTLQTLLPH